MRISDWSSDVCSSDLEQRRIVAQFAADLWGSVLVSDQPVFVGAQFNPLGPNVLGSAGATFVFSDFAPGIVADTWYSSALADAISGADLEPGFIDINSQFSSDFDFYYGLRSEEHTSELQSLMRTSYAVFCLKKKKMHEIPTILR